MPILVELVPGEEVLDVEGTDTDRCHKDPPLATGTVYGCFPVGATLGLPARSVKEDPFALRHFGKHKEERC